MKVTKNGIIIRDLRWGSAFNIVWLDLVIGGGFGHGSGDRW